MKILFLSNIPSPYRIDFFNELGKTCDLTVTFEGERATNRDQKWTGNTAEHFIPMYLHGIRYNEEQFVCFDIFKIIKQNWDLVIVGGYSSITSMMAIEYMKRHHIKFAISADGGFIGTDNRLKFRLKRRYISAASFWFSSGKATTEYLTYYGAKREKCYEYPFTSMTEADLQYAYRMSLRDKSVFRKKLGIQEPNVILAVGQFIQRKGFDLLIRCASHFTSDTGIYLIGGEPTPMYIQILNELNVHNVHFVGFKNKSELAEYYSAADLFVLPTRYDVWGLVVNEALAYGVPVITTDKCIAGIELIKNGENGYIVPVDDLDALITAIDKSFNAGDITENKKMCIESVKEYSIEKMAQKHYEIIKIINNRLS